MKSAVSDVVTQAKFHEDFPPKALVDGCGSTDCSQKWRGRPAEMDVNAIGEWFESHVPVYEADASMTERERELYRFGVAEYLEAFKAKRVTSTEYTAALIKRLLHYKKLNAFTVTSYSEAETAEMLKQAKAIDAIAEAKGVEAVAPLYGLPIAVKGTAATVDFASSGGTTVLDGRKALKDAEIVTLIKKRNGVVLGKTNVPEFAASWVTMNPTNGVTRNPHDGRLTPGGSSGGSAVCIAARLAPLSVSEDTGGSTRNPGAMNGVFGYDPFRNHYPNKGNPALSIYNDQIGLHARSITDIIIADKALNQHVSQHDQAAASVGSAKSPVRVAFPKEYFQRFTVPKGAFNPFELKSCRASKCVRDALAKIEAALSNQSAEGVNVIEAEWETVTSKVLKRKVNALYEMQFGYEVNGAPFNQTLACCYQIPGQTAQWVSEYLGAETSLTDIVNDCRPVGAGHNPIAFMTMHEHVTESAYRFVQVHSMESMVVWNKYFDDNNVDVIVTPSQFGPSPKLADLARATVPIETLQEDGSYKEEATATAVHHNLPIQFGLKHFPVPKMQIPVGKDDQGQLIGVTLWGRSCPPTGACLMSDAFAQEVDIPFLHQARLIADLIHKETGLSMIEPDMNNDLFESPLSPQGHGA